MAIDIQTSTYPISVSYSRGYDAANKLVLSSAILKFFSGFTLDVTLRHGDEPIHGRSRSSSNPSQVPDLWEAALYQPNEWERGGLHCQSGRGATIWEAMAQLDLGDDARDAMRALLGGFFL
jgi:hypothetical protein